MENEKSIETPEMAELSCADLLGDRLFRVYQLRGQGFTFKNIGEQIGVSPGRANQIYRECIWMIRFRFLYEKTRWTIGLSSRIVKIIERNGIKSRNELIDVFESYDPDSKESGLKNYGWKTHKEVAKWLERPEPQEPIKKRIMNVCPHCGKLFPNAEMTDGAQRR
jgi:hypothetical protein